MSTIIGLINKKDELSRRNNKFQKMWMVNNSIRASTK